MKFKNCILNIGFYLKIEWFIHGIDNKGSIDCRQLKPFLFMIVNIDWSKVFIVHTYVFSK